MHKVFGKVVSSVFNTFPIYDNHSVLKTIEKENEVTQILQYHHQRQEPSMNFFGKKSEQLQPITLQNQTIETMHLPEQGLSESESYCLRSVYTELVRLKMPKKMGRIPIISDVH